MIEYEYSFKVKDVTPYLDFCNKNRLYKRERKSSNKSII